MPVSAPFVTPQHNTGAQAQGALLAAQMLEIGKKAAAMLDPSSPLGQAVLHALKTIGKQAGTAPPETQVNSLQSQLIEARRSAMQRLALQQMMMQHAGAQQPPGAQPGAPPGAPQGAPPGAMPQPQPAAAMAA